MMIQLTLMSMSIPAILPIRNEPGIVILLCIDVYKSLPQPTDLTLFLPPLDQALPVEEETEAVRNRSTTCASSSALVPSPRCPSKDVELCMRDQALHDLRVDQWDKRVVIAMQN